MSVNIEDFSKYTKTDQEKKQLIDDVLKEADFKYHSFRSEGEYDEDIVYALRAPPISYKLTKYCPKCARKYPSHETVCLDCFVLLKEITDEINIIDIKSDFKFTYEGENTFNSFEEILTQDNQALIEEFEFTISDFNRIAHNIKAQAFRNFDILVKSNSIDFDNLEITDKVILFAKAFTDVEYKSDGMDLGYFRHNTIFVDDRQTKALQITTVLHELSHFILNEIISDILSELLKCSKNQYIQTIISFILSFDSFCELIDEYAAHNVEGRFTIFGYQDYSSFKMIEQRLEDEMTSQEIEITKATGNTFANHIKDILESLLDDELREDIKDRFKEDMMGNPDFNGLRMENCQKLTDKGFLNIILVILIQAFEIAGENPDKLMDLISEET